MSTARRLRTMIVVALLAGTAVPFAASAAPSGTCPASVATTADGWRRTTVPSFGEGPRGVTAYAVAPEDARTMYATNGYVVLRSTDGGCEWERSYALPGTPSATMPFSSATAEIVDIVLGSKRAYLLLNDGSGPRVLVSDARGGAWSLAATPASVTDMSLNRTRLVADVTGTTAYLLVRVAGVLGGLRASDVLYVTTDGGGTWTPRRIDKTAGPINPADVNDIAVDPRAPKFVWAATNAGLFASMDGGATWMWTPAPSPDWLSLVTVTHREGKPAQVLVASAIEPVVYLRDPAGFWTAINTPGVVTSAVGGRTPHQAAISTSAGVYELDPDALKWHPVSTRKPALTDLSTDYTDSPSLHACACTGDEPVLWSRAPRRAETGKLDRPRDVENPDPDGFPGYFGCAPDPKKRDDAARFPESALVPGAKEITLAPGKSVTVPYRLDVQPRELDLYFLMDTGPRSTYFICAAKQGAVWAAEELARDRNLRVGLGEYRDFIRTDLDIDNHFEATLNNCQTRAREGYVYRRNLRMGGVDDAFRKGVTALAAGGCGDHAALTALQQAVSGEGQDVAPAGSSPYDILPGQQATFGEDSYRVIVHVAGGYFDHQGRTTTYPGTTFNDAITALNDNQVKQVGIHVPYNRKKHHGVEPVPDESGAEDLRRVAAGTGTLASKPVDCGSRVKAHVRVGSPLVCTYVDDASAQQKKPATAPPMGRQIRDLVGALRDPQRMRMSVTSGNAELKGVRVPNGPVDHLQPQTLEYSVTYTCTERDFGTVKEVELAGEVGSSVVASATTTVRCGAPPVEPRRSRVDEVPAGAVLHAPAGAAAANAPPNVNPQANPATQAQTQAQPQNVMQVIGAAVPQEQAEPRLAYTEAGREDGLEELAMSGLPPAREEDVPIWAFASAVALMTSAAGAVSLRRRHATQVARCRIR